MNAWEITKKDVRLLVRDRRTLFMLVALPMAFITILGLSIGRIFSDAEKSRTVRVAVVNEDGTEMAGKIITEATKMRALELLEESDRAHAEHALAEGQADVMIVIGHEYHTRVAELELGDVFFVESGRLAGKLRALDIEVKAGALYANAAQIVEELVFAFAHETLAPEVFRAADPSYAERMFLKAKRQARERRERQKEAGEPATADVPPPPARSDIVYQILVPSYTVMFVFFIVNFMARSFIGEREMGTLDRLRIAPVSRTGLMLGKTIPFLLISLAQTVLLFVAGKFLFQMSWGPQPWLLLPVMFGTSLAATALGLMVATIVRTESQVSAYANFLVLTMAGISGCLMPRSMQPDLMRKLGLVTPHAWSLIAYAELLTRPEPYLPIVWRSCLVLLAFAAGFFAVGWWRFRHFD